MSTRPSSRRPIYRGLVMAGYRYKQQQRLGFLCSSELAEAIETEANKRQIALTELIRQACTDFLAQPQ
jgi:hypothetical protein